MDTRTKVIVVDRKALFEILDTLLEVFHLFVAHADVEERVRFRGTLARIFSLDFDCFLEGIYRRLPLAKLMIYLALK